MPFTAKVNEKREASGFAMEIKNEERFSTSAQDLRTEHKDTAKADDTTATTTSAEVKETTVRDLQVRATDSDMCRERNFGGTFSELEKMQNAPKNSNFPANEPSKESLSNATIIISSHCVDSKLAANSPQKCGKTQTFNKDGSGQESSKAERMEKSSEKVPPSLTTISAPHFTSSPSPCVKAHTETPCSTPSQDKTPKLCCDAERVRNIAEKRIRAPLAFSIDKIMELTPTRTKISQVCCVCFSDILVNRVYSPRTLKTQKPFTLCLLST